MCSGVKEELVRVGVGDVDDGGSRTDGVHWTCEKVESFSV